MMTRAKQRHIRDRLAYWQRRLGLQHYRVALETVPGPHVRQSDEETTLSRMERYPENLTGVWHVAVGRAPDDLEEDACHECLHLLLGETNALVQMLAGMLGPEARAVAQDQWTDIEERLATALERALLQKD